MILLFTIGTRDVLGAGITTARPRQATTRPGGNDTGPRVRKNDSRTDLLSLAMEVTQPGARPMPKASLHIAWHPIHPSTHPVRRSLDSVRSSHVGFIATADFSACHRPVQYLRDAEIRANVRACLRDSWKIANCSHRDTKRAGGRTRTDRGVLRQAVSPSM
jgi:hypothetical protein